MREVSMVDIIINVRRDFNMERLAIIMNQASDELRRRILRILREEGAVIRDEAQENAPVKTGKLKDLIIMRDTPTGIEVIGAASYTGYQELGTKYIQPPKLFMTTAFKNRHPIISQRIQQTIIDYFRELT